MITGYIRVLLGKELKDLWRDRKTLVTTIILPLVMLPLLGLISLALIAQQPVNVAVVDLDSSRSYNPLLNLTVDSKWLARNLTHYLARYGYNVSLTNDTGVIADPEIDVVVVIPKGFSVNASSLNNTAKITVYRKAGYQSAARAEATIYSVVNVFSHNISTLKLKALTRLARVNATLAALRNPVQAHTELVTVQGVPVSIEYELRNAFARILVLALSFVVTPAASYVIDGVIGERERKTIELLLVSPAPLSSIIYAKMLAATILGIIAAVFDALGLVAYVLLAGLSYGANIALIVDYKLLIIHAVTAFFTILATITIALPFITRTRGIRSASNVAGIVTTIGIVFFFTGFMIDYVKLPAEIIYPLYMIPYVHSILAIQTYMLGYLVRSMLHLLFLAIVSIALLVFTTKTINAEKLLIAPS